MKFVNFSRARHVDQNGAVLSIIAGNIVAVATALMFDWSLAGLAAPFWLQSVIIGYYAHQRILALNAFSTQNYRIGGQRPSATEATKRFTAKYFALHYGSIHAFYLLFLFGLGLDQAVMEAGALDLIAVFGLGASFWLSHKKAHKQDVAADPTRTPNIGLPVLLPYLRVIPMHMVIAVGFLYGLTDAIIVFGVLKTIADVAAHLLERRIMRSAPGAPPATGDTA